MPSRKRGGRAQRRLRLGGRAQGASRRCSKLRYTSEPAAQAAAQLRADNDPAYPDALRVYFCDRCLGWHLTSQLQRRRPPAP